MAKSPTRLSVNQVAVIAGGSAGIGRAVAERLAREGYDVAVLARGKKRLKDAVADIEAQHGVQAMAIVCDVSKASAVTEAKDQILDTFGKIDVWVNSAMLTVFGRFDDMDDEEFRAVMDTTFMGQVNGTRAALEAMKPAGHGRIINIGSGLSYRSVPLQSAYCAAKHAINGFTSAVRSELIHEGYDHITLSLVQLPGVNTPQFDWARHKLDWKPRPAAPVFNPEVPAQGVWQAVRTGAREILVGSSAFQLVFGQMVVPNYLDHKMADVGWEGQFSNQPSDGWRDGNLMEPVEGDYEAHGSWDSEALDSGLVVDGDRARYAVFGGLAALGIGLGMLAGGIFGRRLAQGETESEEFDENGNVVVVRRRTIMHVPADPEPLFDD